MKLNEQCHECIYLDKKCKGKESFIPCMSRQTAQEYGLKKVKEIRASLLKDRR